MPGENRPPAQADDGARRDVRRSEDFVGGEAEAATDTIAVLVGARHPLMRAGYRALLEADEHSNVMGEATSGHHAVALAGRAQPDVVLLDLGLPGLEHRDGTVRVVSHPFLVETAVMLMAPDVDDDRAFAGLRAGALGVLASDTEPDELRAAVRMLASGKAVLPATLIDRLIDELPLPGAGREPAPPQPPAGPARLRLLSLA